MTNTSTPPQVPGQYFRWPLLSAPPRMISEAGPCAPDTSVTLKQGASVKAPFGHFENLDIVRSYLLELDFDATWTEGTSEVLTQSPLFPLNLVSNISVSMQAAYKTINMPGWLAQVMQQYRGALAPKSFTALDQNGANTIPPNAPGSTNFGNTTKLVTPNSAVVSGTAYTGSLFLEIPVAQYFDLYWEIDPTDGSPVAAVPRAIVSPARMAATQRNVTPTLTLAQLLGSTDTYDAPVGIAAADTTSTATGTVSCTWWRDGWVPTDNPLTEPVGFGWQYARMSLDVQPAGAKAPAINLADDRAGQGQILSVVFGCWDPALNGGQGGFTPPANYSQLELRKGSTVNLFQDTPNLNAYRWSQKHGASLPLGLFGWDLALTDDGKLTNENALNTLVEAGCQIVPTFSTTPSNNATIYVGVETLQSVN